MGCCATSSTVYRHATFVSLRNVTQEQSMNIVNEPNIIEINGGGVGEGGEKEACSSSPASAASAIAGAGSDGGGGAEWQMVTRAKAKGSGAKKGVGRPRSSLYLRSVIRTPG